MPIDESALGANARRYLREFRAQFRKRGRPPSMAEIADVLIVSRTQAHRMARVLVAAGFLVAEPQSAGRTTYRPLTKG